MIPLPPRSGLALALCLSGALLALAPAVHAQAPATEPAPTPSAPASGTTTATPTAVVTDAGSRIGTFKLVEGPAWLGASDARRNPVPGDGVQQADRVSTGAGGATSIVLKDGTVLTVGPNSTVDLRQFQFDSTTQQGNFLLELVQGSVRVVTGLLARINPERFKVTTPTSVVGVRGTDFIVETQPIAQ